MDLFQKEFGGENGHFGARRTNALYNKSVVDCETRYIYASTKHNNYFAKVTAISDGAASFKNRKKERKIYK